MKLTYDFDPKSFTQDFFFHGRPEGVTIHRIDPPAPYTHDAKGVRDFYQHHPEGEGFAGKMPFHLVIDPQGTTTQTVPLDRQTPHARSYNATHAAIGCIGDFRKAPMPAAQLGALVGTIGYLAHSAGFPTGKPAVLGHTEDATATAHTEADSPSRCFSLDEVRAQARATVKRLQRGDTDAELDLVWESRCTRGTLS